MHRGYTKRWRKRWDKGYHNDFMMWVLMDYFIDFANHKDGEAFIRTFGMVPLKRGQHLFGTNALAAFMGVDRQRIRTCLKKLEKINFLTTISTNKFSIATVINYDTYQPVKDDANQQANQCLTSSQPAPNQHLTTPKELKNYKKDKNKDKDTPIGVLSLPPKKSCPHQKIVESYHKHLPSLPRVTSLSPALRKRIGARWGEDKARQDIEWWDWYFDNINQCDFLVGRVKDWTAEFNWLVGPQNMDKVLNGRYLNRKHMKEQQDMQEFCSEG